MGFPPPPDGPPPAIAAGLATKANFSAGLPAVDLCFFKIPAFLFKISFGISISITLLLPKLPTFRLSLGLRCDLNNPLAVDAGIDWGGGRVPTFDANPDLEFEARAA